MQQQFSCYNILNLMPKFGNDFLLMSVKLFCCKELLFINKKKEINKSNKSNVCCRKYSMKKKLLHEIHLVSIS